MDSRRYVASLSLAAPTPEGPKEHVSSEQANSRLFLSSGSWSHSETFLPLKAIKARSSNLSRL